jgi:hypothetical protein
MTINKSQCDNGNRNISIAEKIVYPRCKPDTGIPFGNLNIVDYDGKNIMTPISLPMTDDIPFIYLEGKPYIDPNMIMKINEWKSLISKINMKVPHEYKDKYSKDDVQAMVTNSYSKLLKTEKSDNISIIDYGFTELEGVNYNYFKNTTKNLIDFKWVKNIREKVLNEIKREFNNVSFKIPQCASQYNPCDIEEVEWRILKLGKNKNGNKAIEGQLLIAVKNRPQLILIRYVASDENSYMLYTIYIEGIGDRSSRLYENQYKSFHEEGNIIPNPNPIIKKDILIDISMNEPQIVKPRSELIKVVEKTLNNFYEPNEYKCYGMLSHMRPNKNECEAVYDPAGRPNKEIGVWDKECRKDEECPFFKANKNYPNNFGGCIQGKCQMPYGITQVSPFKYRNESEAVCFRCKDGTLNCCEEQKDKKKYPTLKSPDYKFEGDERLRLQYYYMLK